MSHPTRVEPEVAIGEVDRPVGTVLATLLGDQAKGHTKVFAILNSDVQVRPATLMVSKVTVTGSRYTNILMGSVQAGIAHGVLDAVRAGDIPKDKANDLGLIDSVWLDPAVLGVPPAEVDHAGLFAVNREATAKATRKAMRNEPTIDWLLAYDAPSRPLSGCSVSPRPVFCPNRTSHARPEEWGCSFPHLKTTDQNDPPADISRSFRGHGRGYRGGGDSRNSAPRPAAPAGTSCRECGG